jgi:hypothetical protein
MGWSFTFLPSLFAKAVMEVIFIFTFILTIYKAPHCSIVPMLLLLPPSSGKIFPLAHCSRNTRNLCSFIVTNQ